MEEIQQALQTTDDGLNRANADEALRNLIAGHIASIEAFLLQAPAFAGEKPEKLIKPSQRAQQLLPEDEKGIRSVNALNIGYGYAALADYPAAERAYQQAFEDGVAGGNYYAAVYGPINLIAIAIIKGRLKEALQLCETNIDRFNRLLAGQRFPPIGDLSILKGSILLEENRLMEAEQALTQGLSLIRWTGEFEALVRGYSALARLRSIQGDRSGMLESIISLEETRPEVAMYAQALRHRLSAHDPVTNKTSLEEARHWVTQEAVRFDNLPEITGVDPVSEIYFRTYLCAAHILTRLAVRNPQAYSLSDVHRYKTAWRIAAASPGGAPGPAMRDIALARAWSIRLVGSKGPPQRSSICFDIRRVSQYRHMTSVGQRDTRRQMGDGRVIVIGDGVGGLAAAIELAACGLEVEVHEREAAPGGKLRELRVDGVGIDSGPTVLTMRWVFEELFARAGASLGADLELRPAGLLARHSWGPGACLDLHAEVGRSAEAIGASAGADEARRFRAFAAEAAAVYRTLEAPYLRGSRPTPPPARDHGPTTRWAYGKGAGGPQQGR